MPFQSGGLFAGQGNCSIANGPSEGTVAVSGGDFRLTNALGNATMVVGAQSPGASSPGKGRLEISGGLVMLDRLVATHGAD